MTSDSHTKPPTLRPAAKTPISGLGSTVRPEERARRTLDVIEALTQQFDSEWEGMPAQLDFELPGDFLLSVVVPVYNEQATICRVIGSLFTLPLPLEVIVVDDGSTDGTCAMLTELNRKYPALNVLFHETNRGKGAALRHGFASAHGSHVIVQDADLEYDPRDIPELIRALTDPDVDVVYGSRFLESRHEGSSWIHRYGNRLLTWASNRITGWQLTDMETCYKVFPRELLDAITIEQDGFGFEVELTAKLAKQAARVIERPISYHARSWEEGKKISWRDGLRALYCIFKYR